MGKKADEVLNGPPISVPLHAHEGDSREIESDKAEAVRNLIENIIRSLIGEHGKCHVPELAERVRGLYAHGPIVLKDYTRDRRAVNNLKGAFLGLLLKGNTQDAGVLKFYLGSGVGFRRQVETALRECVGDREKFRKIRESFPHKSLCKEPEDDEDDEEEKDIEVPRFL